MPARRFAHVRVLINEDAPADAELVEREIGKVVHEPDFLRVQTKEAFLAALTGFKPDLIISDYYLPTFDGITALKLTRAMDRDRPFILVSGSLGEEIAIDTMKEGATDYVLKDRLTRLAPAVERALQDAANRDAKKIMEGRLEEREQLLNSVFEEAPIGITLISVEGQLMLANKKFHTQLGHERGDLIGGSVLELTHPDDRAESGARLLQVVRGEISGYSREKRYVRKDGTFMWAELSATVLRDPAGHTRFILTMVLDISERRRFLDVLVRQERLRALGQMASAIAHDVNNALSPVLGYAELIETQEATLSARSLRHLQTIKTAAGDIGRIVGRMREFYQAREEGTAPIRLDANTLLEEVIEMTAPRWRTETRQRGIGVDLAREFAADLPQLTGVATDIRECLVNLVFNAIDAMASGGRIVLRSVRQEHTIVLEVADTGPGMDAVTRQRCLEPFFTTKGAAGTGLGLASVAAVMRRYGGAVEIDSEPGRGTTVRLVFPLGEMTGSAGVVAVTAAAIPSPMRILCIDDEAPIRTLMEDLLIPDGHRVDLASGGHPGLDLFKKSLAAGDGYDVVITDHGMGGMNGRQVAAAVKALSADTPVILMTGWAPDTGAGALPLANVDHVLHKPPSRDDIRRLLAAIACRRKN